MDAGAFVWYKSNMSRIENYNLYGEAQEFPDVVHCETIQHRSLIHDWEFKPHRHARLHQFLLLESGHGTALLEEFRHDLCSGDLVNVAVGSVHGFTFRPDTKGWVVTLASELLEEGLIYSEGLRPMLQQSTKIRYGAEIRSVVQLIFKEYPTRSFARAHVLRALSGVLTGLVAREIAAKDPQDLQPDHSVQRRFEALLEDNYLSHLGVADYAARLGVTPTHLSRVMRHATGQPASAFIETRLIREARRHLAFSNLSVSEIAYQLGFADPAYFGRAFKRATGQSPLQFRRNLEA